jgi:Tfp pilus assembly protein PilE
MRPAFTLIEILSGIFIMSVITIVSMQSVNYLNYIHQQNELRYLALNRIDSEMSRLVMAYENYTNFTDSDINGKYNGNNATNSGEYGLKISTGTDKINFVQLKNIGTNNFNKVENGDFVGILEWNATKNGNEANLSLNLSYPYIYRSDSDYSQLWNHVEIVNLKTSTKVR